ncbi:MAG TPA: cupredoxin domain-containing protein [Candidatus Limnocylindrales bacterium]|jgi:uncharacterized cupredoxin-like copper-binding protein|nr:cupredoxin domain-containing protein [Candidatus Limnocylindrales bacterium]
MRLVLVVALGVAVGLMALAAASPGARTTVEIDVRYSRFQPAAVRVPTGVPVTFVFRNHDPIDHEWIVGDEALHAYHRNGTEPIHGDRPTEVMLPAATTRTTTVIFAESGRLQFICHLPAHEAYGMVGVVEVIP